MPLNLEFLTEDPRNIELHSMMMDNIVKEAKILLFKQEMLEINAYSNNEDMYGFTIHGYDEQGEYIMLDNSPPEYLSEREAKNAGNKFADYMRRKITVH